MFALNKIMRRKFYELPLLMRNFHSAANAKIEGPFDMPPMPDIHKFLMDHEPLMPANAHFSVLDPRFIRRSVSEMRELFAAIGTTSYSTAPSQGRLLRNLVVFNPRRALLHEIMILLTTTIQLPREKDFVETTSVVFNSTEGQINKAIKRIAEKQIAYEEMLYKEICYYLSGHPLSDIFARLVPPVGSVIHQRIQDGIYQPGHYQASDTLETVLQKILLDDWIRQSYSQEFRNIAKDSIKDFMNAGELSPLKCFSDNNRINLVALPVHADHTRRTIMVAGGPASGKGILTSKLFDKALRGELPRAHFASIEPDRLAAALNTGYEDIAPMYHATILQEESSMIAEGSRDHILSMVRTEGKAPHTFVEMLVPYPDKVDLGTAGGGQFRVYIASADPVAALNGSFRRFREIHRHTPVEYVLGGQKKVSVHLPNMINDKQITGKNIFIEIFNTTMAEDGSLPEKGDSPIAMINLLESKTIISNLPLMYEFIKKEEINPHATNTAMIFFNQPSSFDLLQKLLQEYAQSTLYFANPEVVMSPEKYTKHIYATYEAKTKKLTIVNQEVFNQMMQRPVYREALTYMNTRALYTIEPSVGSM